MFTFQRILKRRLRLVNAMGKPVILKVNALAMFEQGHQFFVSENGVWLTKMYL